MGSICSNPIVAVPCDLPSVLSIDSDTTNSSPYPLNPILLLNWLHSDIAEGDELLVAMLQLLPAYKHEIKARLTLSTDIRKSNSEWQTCRTYIHERYLLCGRLCCELTTQEQVRKSQRKGFLTEIEGEMRGSGDLVPLLTPMRLVDHRSEEQFLPELSTVLKKAIETMIARCRAANIANAQAKLLKIGLYLAAQRSTNSDIRLYWFRWRSETIRVRAEAEKSAIGRNLEMLKSLHREIKGELGGLMGSARGSARGRELTGGAESNGLCSRGVNTDVKTRKVQNDSMSFSIERVEIANICGENHAKKGRKTVDNHARICKNLAKEFSESHDPMQERENNGEELASGLEATESLLSSARQSTSSVLSSIQPSFPSWFDPPKSETEDLRLFGANYSKENDPLSANSKKKDSSHPSKSPVFGDSSKIIRKKDDEIERLTAELTSAKKRIFDLEIELESAKRESVHISAPHSPTAKFVLTISPSDSDSKDAIKLKAFKSALTQSNSRILATKRLSFVTWAHRSVLTKNSPNESYFDDIAGDMDVTGNRFLNLEVEIREIQLECMMDNVLLQVKDRKAGTDKAFTELQLLRFFEDVMSKKYECDQMDLKNHRCPKSIPVFIKEYLTRMFGLPKLAIKTINQILPTLEICCKNGQQYAVIFAQLAQIFHKSPVSYLFSLFLTRKMIEFEEFSCKKTQFTPTKDAKHYSFTGGEALLSDIIPLIYSLFETDRTSGQHLIRILKPQNVSVHDYVLYHVGLRLAKIAINPEHLFGILEENGHSESSFVAGLRRSLEIWVTRDELKSALKSLVGADNLICKATLIGKVTHKMYQKYAQSGDFEVSKYTFLQGLIEVYQSYEIRYFASIKVAIESYRPDCIPLNDFSSILRRLDPAISSYRISNIYQSIIGNSAKMSIDFHDLVRGLTRHPVGMMSRSVFCKGYIGTKELMDMFGDQQEDVIKSLPGSPGTESVRKVKRTLLFSDVKCRTPVPFMMDRNL